jgi:hypothetical protein
MEDIGSQTVIVAEKEADIILPPPTALNPVPVLPVALRVDNREQLLGLLESDPHSASSTFRQLLVFGTESLRTLLLRHVMSDPHTRTFKGKKKNWDDLNSFQYPKTINVVGTIVLHNHEKADETPQSAFPDDATSWDNYRDGKQIDVVTYFLRPTDVAQTQLAARRIHAWKKQIRIHHRVVYLPQASALIRKILNNMGLTTSPNVSIQQLQMDIFPLETDILSLEYDDAVRESEVEQTPSNLITTVARSILKLQDVVGKIPHIQSYGALGEEVVRKTLDITVDEYLARDRVEEEVGEVMGGQVDALVIIDRKVDMVTPMLTPLTYEGLLDDVVGIDCGFINVDVDVINPEDSTEKKSDAKREIVSLGVNASDSLYNEVRNQHVEKFGSFLQNQAMALRQSHAEFTSQGKKKDLSEIHQFVKNIPMFTQNLRSLTNHIHLAELVKKTSEEPLFRERWQTERAMLEGETCYETLEDLVAYQYAPFKFFRLLCLQSLCSNGIKSSRYDALRRDIVQTYGYEYLFVLENLELAGLLSRREGLWMDTTSPFNNLRKSVHLINAEVDTVDPDDISYVSSGYAPLSVRILQTAVKGWNTRSEILRELPGRLIDVIQQNPPEELSAALKRPVKKLGADTDQDTQGKKKPTLMVMYVGGVTYMEIAALRFLSKRPGFPFHIIICTSKIINGDKLLKSLA